MAAFRVVGSASILALLCSGCQPSSSGDPSPTSWLELGTGGEAVAEPLTLFLRNERDFSVGYFPVGPQAVSISGQLSDLELDAARGLLTAELRALYAEELIVEESERDPECERDFTLIAFADPLNPTDWQSRLLGIHCSNGTYSPETEAMVAEFKALAFALLEANGGTAPPP